MRANPRGLFRSFALAALAAAWLLAGAARAAEADLRLAKDYFHAQRYSDALVSLRKVLKDDPESVDGNYYMGLVYLENKKASTARNFFLRALQLDPSRDDAADKAIQTLRAEARGSAARRRRVLEHPVRKYQLYLPPVLVDLFKVYASQKETGLLLRLARGLAERVDRNEVSRKFQREAAAAFVMAAKVAYAAGDITTANDFLERARAQNSVADGIRELTDRIKGDLLDKATPFKEKADGLALEGQYPEALNAYKRALEIYPGWSEAKQGILATSNLQEAERLFAEAEKLEAAGDEAGALEKIGLAIQKTPTNAVFKHRAEGILQRMQDREASLRARKEAEDEKDRERRARFAAAWERGKDEAESGNWSAALEAYEEADRHNPNDPKVREKLEVARAKAKVEGDFTEAVKAFKTRRFKAAMEGFQAVHAKDPDYDNLKRYLALTYFEQGRVADAQAAAQDVLQASPRSRDMLYLLGVIHHDRVAAGEGSPGTAITYFEKIADPNFKDTGDRLADLKWRQNRVPMLIAAIAVVLWMVALFWSKKRPEILKNSFLGKVEKYAAKENWKALSLLEDDARNFPLDRTQDLAVSTAMAQAFYNLKDTPRATSWCQMALSKARENPDLMTLMGRIYYEGGVISQEVLRFLVHLAKQEPDNLELMKFIGFFCLDRQVINEDTMPILRNLALAMPEHDKLRRQLIRGYLRNNEKGARAMALYRVELEKDPDNVELRYMVAQDALKANRVDEAVKHAELILNTKLNHRPTHDLLRDAYAKLGKLDELARIYQGILEQDPYNPAVQDSLKLILDPEAAKAKAATTPGEGGPKRCDQCGQEVKVGQYYCVCGAPL